MQEIIVYHAKCNKAPNAAMNEVIKARIPDPWNLPLEGYFFKKLSAILEHYFVSDMVWMKAFSDIDPCGLDLVAAVRAIPGYGDSVFGSYVDYLEHRGKLDDFIIAYAEKLPDDIFHKTLSRTTRSGEKMDRTVYKAMAHFFNHQTHHRGQISNILDWMNIENNYSNMIFFDV